jgi:hypothetical protein
LDDEDTSNTYALNIDQGNTAFCGGSQSEGEMTMKQASEGDLTKDQLAARWGCSPGSITRRRKADPSFPQPYRAGSSRAPLEIFRRAEVEAYERRQAEASKDRA